MLSYATVLIYDFSSCLLLRRRRFTLEFQIREICQKSARVSEILEPVSKVYVTRWTTVG